MNSVLELFENCQLCPHQCGVNRFHEEGYCQAPVLYKNKKIFVKINLYQPFFFEEPIITGKGGSGNIFFSHCGLRCFFCQNYDISHKGYGYFISVQRFEDIVCELARKGCQFINLVNPTHYLPFILAGIKKLKRKFTQSLRFVYNTHGYEMKQSLLLLENLVDIFLPDYKFEDQRLSDQVCNAPEYSSTCSEAIHTMRQLAGESILDSDGLLKRGLLVRHLVLPNYSQDSIRILKTLSGILPENSLISLMSQFIPVGDSNKNHEFNRTLYESEYQEVVDFLIQETSFEGYIQDMDSANECYIPKFQVS